MTLLRGQGQGLRSLRQPLGLPLSSARPAMKDATIAAASGLPFETWISRSLAACLFVPLLCPPVHGAFRCVQ